MLARFAVPDMNWSKDAYERLRTRTEASTG